MLVNKTLCIGTKNKLLRKEVDAFVYGKIKESGLLHAVKAETYENGLLYKFKTAVEIDLMDIPLGADMKFDEKSS